MNTKELGEELRRIRIEQNLTGKELGRKSGWSWAAIYRLERGETSFISFQMLSDLLEVLGYELVLQKKEKEQ